MSNRQQNTAPVGDTILPSAPTWATSSERQSERSISWRSDSIDLGRVEYEWPGMSVALRGIDSIGVHSDSGVTLDHGVVMIEMTRISEDGEPDHQGLSPMLTIEGARRVAAALLELCDAVKGEAAA
jgi:hypothetical protein